jgi:hypothetical protein
MTLRRFARATFTRADANECLQRYPRSAAYLFDARPCIYTFINAVFFVLHYPLLALCAAALPLSCFYLEFDNFHISLAVEHMHRMKVCV